MIYQSFIIDYLLKYLLCNSIYFFRLKAELAAIGFSRNFKLESARYLKLWLKNIEKNCICFKISTGYFGQRARAFKLCIATSLSWNLMLFIFFCNKINDRLPGWPQSVVDRSKSLTGRCSRAGRPPTNCTGVPGKPEPETYDMQSKSRVASKS